VATLPIFTKQGVIKMGSLTSTPKVVNAPASSSTSASTATTQTEETSSQTKALESEERKKSLLARERSRSGTISTTLKGVLSSADEGIERKTLLGQ
jgi:hypothetical protein